MDNIKTAKTIVMDVQGVLKEAVNKLDSIAEKLEGCISANVAFKAVHEMSETCESHINNLSVSECCYILLKKYQGHEPTEIDLQTLKTSLELTLCNDYGVDSSRFE